ncbi:MAG: succinate dehydrogenase cytochrome b subunit [Candidatus Electrothrix sp. GW3-4]|uniref:succinate dehydrogenase cytochrome b subunit n=1 Tax=Candidatus Electrothrix sp. GW3-4 TaxID=3126740 RepID=UPI0030D3C4CA
MFDFLQGTLSSLGRKYTMALTGFFLGVFLLSHAVGNSFIFQGKAAFNAYAEQLHSLGPLVPAVEFFLLIIFLTHIVFGISLFLKNRKAIGRRYVVASSAGGDTWVSRTMPWTGLIILAFLLLHLCNVRFVEDSGSIADVVDQTLTTPLYTLLYLLGITALTLHTSHGFWSLLQTWGLYYPRYHNVTRLGACALAVLICLVFFAVIVALW